MAVARAAATAAAGTAAGTAAAATVGVMAAARVEVVREAATAEVGMGVATAAAGTAAGTGAEAAAGTAGPGGAEPSMATLLAAYFRYMAELTSGAGGVAISLHEDPLGRGKADGLPPYCFKQSRWPNRKAVAGFSIEDPFETVRSIKPHDLCAPLTPKSYAVLQSEYQRAARLLNAHGDPSAPERRAERPERRAERLLEELLRSGPSPCRRLAEDGKYYDEAEFLEFFGPSGSAVWANGREETPRQRWKGGGRRFHGVFTARAQV